MYSSGDAHIRRRALVFKFFFCFTCRHFLWLFPIRNTSVILFSGHQSVCGYSETARNTASDYLYPTPLPLLLQRLLRRSFSRCATFLEVFPTCPLSKLLLPKNNKRCLTVFILSSLSCWFRLQQSHREKQKFFSFFELIAAKRRILS